MIYTIDEAKKQFIMMTEPSPYSEEPRQKSSKTDDPESFFHNFFVGKL